MSKTPKTILVLAATGARATRAAEARGIPAAEVAYGKDLREAQRWADLPMLIDWSLPSHPEGAMLAEFAAAYIWRKVPTRWRRGSRRLA